MLLLVGVLALAGLTGCGSSTPQTQSIDCVPTVDGGAPLSTPDLRHEDIVEVLTGERQTGDHDPIDVTVTDPNFGGVWGDRQGGIVVAVLDCSEIDANELAYIAGGSEYLHLIEVPHTFRQVNDFRDALVREVDALGIEAGIYVESTLSGRMIEVHVLDVSALPDSFGSEIPDDAYVVIESETVGTVPAG